VPYLYVALGPADVINAVQGKREVRLVMADGQVVISAAGFAHIAARMPASSSTTSRSNFCIPRASREIFAKE